MGLPGPLDGVGPFVPEGLEGRGSVDSDWGLFLNFFDWTGVGAGSGSDASAGSEPTGNSARGGEPEAAQARGSSCGFDPTPAPLAPLQNLGNAS
jgi:hypothetical protein